MPTEVLPLGVPTTMLAGVAYALPAVKVTLFADGAPTLTQSNTAAYTASQTVTLVAGQITLSGGFLKAVANALVTLKKD